MEISIEKITSELDAFLHQNDYASAEKHLLFWLERAEKEDARAEIFIRNELMGLYRKIGKREEALDQTTAAIAKIEEIGAETQSGSATTYLNSATVYKAFGMADRAMPLFERAKAIYEQQLDPLDARLGGLYNNMGLALVDLSRFREADELYKKALVIMEKAPRGALECAITHLNIATAAEREFGLEQGDEKIQNCLNTAKKLLEDHENRDGYYAFVCEKCASVFGYYGHFIYENQLKERAAEIYERSRTQ